MINYTKVESPLYIVHLKGRVSGEHLNHIADVFSNKNMDALVIDDSVDITIIDRQSNVCVSSAFDTEELEPFSPGDCDYYLKNDQNTEDKDV